MREKMNKNHYESPELDICWFESDDVIANSQPIVEPPPGDGFTPDDEW